MIVIGLSYMGLSNELFLFKHHQVIGLASKHNKIKSQAKRMCSHVYKSGVFFFERV